MECAGAGLLAWGGKGAGSWNHGSANCVPLDEQCPELSNSSQPSPCCSHFRYPLQHPHQVYEALRQLGLHNSTAGRQAVVGARPAGAVRADLLTSTQRQGLRRQG